MVNEYTYLSLFTQNPNKTFSLQEFEEHHKKPHQTIKRYLDQFVDLRILSIDKRKRFRFYKLNLDNPLTLDALSICEKLRFRERFMEEYLLKQLYDDLSKHFSKCSFLIFGSATQGGKYNDIDVLCFGREKELEKTRSKFEEQFNKPIHLIISNERNLSEVFREQLIKKHIILNNHDRFVKLLFGKNQLVQTTN